MSACNLLKTAILDHIVGRATWTPAATWYIGLHTGDPGADGTENEVSTTDTGYTRKSVAAADAQWTDETGGVIENVNNLAWNSALIDWGTITHFSIHTASTGAAGLVKQALVADIPITTGNVFQFAPGKLRVSVL